MNEKLKKELESTNYSKQNLGIWLLAVILILSISFFIFVVPPSSRSQGSPTIQTQQEQPRFVQQKVHVLTVPKVGCTAPVGEIDYRQCIKWYGPDPDGDDFYTQLRESRNSPWVDWIEWRRGKKKDIHSLRFCSRGDEALAYYEFHKRGQCD